MTSPAHHEATMAAMKAAGCESVPGVFGTGLWCGLHDEDSQWDEDRDVCPVIDSAARIAYGLGRRDALNKAADLLRTQAASNIAALNKESMAYSDMYGHGADELTKAAERVRSLASTPTNEGAETIAEKENDG